MILEFGKELINKNSSIGKTKVQSIILEYLKGKKKKSKENKIKIKIMIGFIGDNSPEVRRTASESLGMLARTEGDQVTNDLIKFCVGTVIIFKK